MPHKLCKNLHLCLPKIKIAVSCGSGGSFVPPSPTNKNHHRLSSSKNRHYDITSDSETLLESTSKSNTDVSSSTSSDAETPPDIATAFASHRFFFSSPGRSNSIIEASSSCRSLPKDYLAVSTYSPDPYLDFKRSMEEMVEARGLNVKSDWECLKELLLCYLTLNPKNTHKFIVGAFSDLLASLMTSEGHRSEIPARLAISHRR